ncbi:hypothetical protein RFI_37201 [Reticulomyxa filosa]|uniref:Uncharacterized protein n=1 Tax=Reticulomyxa filosa TaxID=46433 RepID=X6LF90_RETFI|nr:hypothetical protein RFI_37201 [Reticulomyxa filosa]|eukprot:ETO00244.1 hypothetical protein RFI_37201 [Reticulomyxa filosa]
MNILSLTTSVRDTLLQTLVWNTLHTGLCFVLFANNKIEQIQTQIYTHAKKDKKGRTTKTNKQTNKDFEQALVLLVQRCLTLQKNTNCLLFACARSFSHSNSETQSRLSKRSKEETESQKKTFDFWSQKPLQFEMLPPFCFSNEFKGVLESWHDNSGVTTASHMKKDVCWFKWTALETKAEVGQSLLNIFSCLTKGNCNSTDTIDARNNAKSDTCVTPIIRRSSARLQEKMRSISLFTEKDDHKTKPKRNTTVHPLCDTPSHNSNHTINQQHTLSYYKVDTVWFGSRRRSVRGNWLVHLLCFVFFILLNVCYRFDGWTLTICDINGNHQRRKEMNELMSQSLYSRVVKMSLGQRSEVTLCKNKTKQTKYAKTVK